jgi:cardiolipin synthase
VVTGPLAQNLASAFDTQFHRADTEHGTFTRFRRSLARSAVACTDGELHLSGPGRGRNTIKRALLADLETARRVQIAAGYFLLAGRLRRALLRVVRRGGTVQLVLAGQSDVALSQLASQAHYQRYLRAGVEIWEYQPQVLHSKLVIADQAVYVGSSNLDPRSLHINYELMLRLTNPVVVSEAREIFADHLANSRRVDPVAWARSRSLWRRFKERWASFLLGRLDRVFMRWQLQRLDSTVTDPS